MPERLIQRRCEGVCQSLSAGQIHFDGCDVLYGHVVKIASDPFSFFILCLQKQASMLLPDIVGQLDLRYVFMRERQPRHALACKPCCLELEPAFIGVMRTFVDATEA